jgi:hypothetical protein
MMKATMNAEEIARKVLAEQRAYGIVWDDNFPSLYHKVSEVLYAVQVEEAHDLMTTEQRDRFLRGRFDS